MASFFMKMMSKAVGKTVTFLSGSLLLLIVHCFIAFGSDVIENNLNIVYVLAIGIGIGHSIALIQSLVGTLPIKNLAHFLTGTGGRLSSC